MALINTTTRQEFEDKVLQSDKVVLVDFWAQWCPPCRMMAPALETVASTMHKDADVVKVDIEASDDNNRLAGEYGVRGIPNMQIFKNGKVVQELVGLQPAMNVEQALKAAAQL